MNIIGIDPGKSGAIAFLSDGRLIYVYNLPLKLDVRGKDDIDSLALSRMIIDNGPTDLVVMEQVHSKRGDGPVGAFTFGRIYGKLRGILEMMGLPTQEVPPQTWKAVVLKGTDKSKEAAIGWASSRYPLADLRRTHLCRGPSHDRAEAICLAEWGRLYLQTHA